ncbi:MAG: 3-deoxy-D-manno-octulosonic acid transferase [Candidatus Omnitrophota bacterium]|jgi:3-deoxy-D-manno-octulosonic-acid transferase|nr:MAG: 3-deoxy-D-manno-octulosonic acid transferase [Candidatus Omnitrophota bacterium]
MTILIDLLYFIGFIFYLPLLVFKGKLHREFFFRLGFIPKVYMENPIWIHAVSVGEVMAIKKLVYELKAAFPRKRFVISTVTATGNKVAKTLAGGRDYVTYLPFDFSFIVSKVMRRIKPSLFIVAETEIWPNLINYLHHNNIPLITINGRISDKSFIGYKRIKFILRHILNKVSLFCVQTEEDAKRLMALGVGLDKMDITGNLKFDLNYGNEVNPENYRSRLGIVYNEKLFVAGSTHKGEDEIIFSVYKRMRQSSINIKLLIAPRHPERARDVASLAKKFGFNPQLISAIPFICETCITQPVFILDTIGELPGFYSAADIVFIGGSLTKNGGHNIIEPASHAKPVLFGPWMFNFREIARMFLDKSAAIMVRDEDELFNKAVALLRNESEASLYSERAKELVLKHRGATARTLKHIMKFITK